MIFDQILQSFRDFANLALPIGVKVVMAILCGGIIGLERELKNKAAGIKTNILICLGSTLYTIISILVAQAFTDSSGFHGDPARIAAQIVPGIGFIGAGTIMQSRASVIGLTTAATIWIVAAIGMCIGSGYPVVSFVFTLTVLFTLLAIDKLEAKFLGRSGAFALEIKYEDDESGEAREAINKAMSRHEIALEDFDVSRDSGGRILLRIQYKTTRTLHRRFILDLWKIKGIREVRQE